MQRRSERSTGCFLKYRITLAGAVIRPSPVAAAIDRRSGRLHLVHRDRRKPMIAWSQCFGFGPFRFRPSFSTFRAVLRQRVFSLRGHSGAQGSCARPADRATRSAAPQRAPYPVPSPRAGRAAAQRCGRRSQSAAGSPLGAESNSGRRSLPKCRLERKADGGRRYRLHHRSSNLVGRSKSVMSQMCILTR